jgi:recombinational DNA repair protein (RecF pathway)
MLFIIDRLLPEQQSEPEIYTIAVKFLIYTSKSDKISTDRFAGFLHDIIRVLGYGTNDSSLSDLLRAIEEIINEKIPEHVII